MIRVEIIANQSVEERIKNNLEAVIPDFYYTVIPLVYGRGAESRKLGTTTWPETNFILVAYCEDKYETDIRTVIDYVKSKFSDEGIKLFIMHESV